MNTSIAITDLENFYDALAEAIDQATPEKSPLFLAKLALQLASEVKDPKKLTEAIAVALKDL